MVCDAILIEILYMPVQESPTDAPLEASVIFRYIAYRGIGPCLYGRGNLITTISIAAAALAL